MKKGFTLIELMVVLAIIAIITAILVPSLMKAKMMAAYDKYKEENPSEEISLHQFKVKYLKEQENFEADDKDVY